MLHVNAWLAATFAAAVFSAPTLEDPSQPSGALISTITKLVRLWAADHPKPLVLCYIDFNDLPLRQLLLNLLAVAHRSSHYNVVLSTDAILSSTKQHDRRCSLTLVAFTGDKSLRNLEMEGDLKRWNRFGLFVIVHYDRLTDGEMIRTVWKFGLSRTLFVRWISGAEVCEIKYPLVYRDEVVAVDWDTVRHWMKYDQQRDLHGHGYVAVLAQSIPYLYKRASKIESGIDYQFMTNVVRHQNASLQWFDATSIGSDKVSFFKMISEHYASRRVATVYLDRSVKIATGDTVYLSERDTQCILLAKPRIGSYFLHLLRPFYKEVWITVGCLSVLLLLVRKLCPRIFKQDYMLAVFFGSAIEDYRMGQRDRVIIFVAGLLLFLLSEAYLAVMITFMFNTKFEPELENVAQLASTEILLQVPPEHYMAVNAYYSDLVMQIGSQMNYASDNESVVSRLYDPRKAYLVPCSHGHWTVSRPYMRAQSDFQFYVIDENLYFSQQSFCVGLKNMITERIAEYVQRFYEGGFWDQWESMETDYFARQEAIEQPDVLTFYALVSLFWILGVGYILALWGFFAELTYKRWIGRLH